MDKGFVKIGSGRTAEIFRYSEDKVLKLYRAAFPRKAIDEEFRIGLYLNNIGLAIARTYELFELEGATGIVFEYIDGVSMLQNLAKKPWLLFSYSKQMARLQWHIHQTSLDINHGIPSLKESLEGRISRAPLLASEEKSLLVSHLRKLKDGSAICHGDFHPDNIIVSKNGLVTVDWITARIGDPIADVARTSLLLTMGTLPEGKTSFEIFLTKYFRNVFYNRYIRQYKKLSGLSDAVLEDWKLPVAAARLLENVSPTENQNLLKFIRTRLPKI